MTEAAVRILRAMDGAVAEWYVPVIGKEVRRRERGERGVGFDGEHAPVFRG